MKTSAAHQPTPHTLRSGGTKKNSDRALLESSSYQRRVFLLMALNMSWQLALVVLVPVLAGVGLDKATHASAYVFVGLGLAVLGSIAVMWHTMQVANRLPVPKLTAAQKRAIKKAYEAEDADE